MKKANLVLGTMMLLVSSLSTSLMAQGGGTCSYFDGTDDYLTTGGANYGYNTLTTEFWAYATDWTPTSTQILVTLNTNGGGNGYKIELRSSDIRFFLDAGSDEEITVSTSSLAEGWHHIAATYDGSNMNLWVDGELNATTGQTGNVDYGTYVLRIGTHSDGTDDFDGYIDELRFWRVARSQSEIQSLMHLSGTTIASFTDLRGYYRFESTTTPAYLDNEGNASGNDLTNSGCTFTDKKIPIGDFTTGYTTDPEAVWIANGLNWSDESSGLALQDYNIQTIGNDEFYAFANNGSTGTSTSDLPTDVDIRASTIWLIDAVAQDRINFNFDLSDFGASAMEVSGLAAANYKLLRRTGTSGDFTMVASGSSISSGEIYFEDYDPDETDAYFTIGRDNDLASVTTTAAASIGFMEATSGGEVTGNGGGTVSEQGICYSKTSPPTTSDIKKKDYSGQNPFTKTIYDLVPNTTYYIRAYAINSEGTAYGGVQSFTTTSTTNWTPSGAGTSVSPYQIANLNNLVWMMETESSWDSYFELTADIDATATSSWDGGKGFAPIGRQIPTEDQFNGFLEGNGHIISNLYINRPNTNDVGLFGYTDRDYGQGTSYVQNLGMESVNFTGGYRTAGLIARSTSITSNCYVSGSVTGDKSNSIAAGLIGQSHQPITNCYSTASVSAEYEAAGFVSFNNSDIEDCYSTGAVTDATENLDGFCNDIDGHGSGTISNSFWDTQISGQSSSSGGTGKNTAEMKNFNTYTDEATAGLTTAWDFVTNPNDDIENNEYWDMDQEGTVNDGYPILYFQDGADEILPVELLNFSANCNIDNSVELNWSTASETNNSHFEIQQSVDADNFIEIGRLEGLRNSNSLIHYSFLTEKLKDSPNYFRLKQIDLDGKFEYSNIISVYCNENFFKIVEVYPNPFKSEISINFSTPIKSKNLVQIRDIIGSLITEVEIDVNKSKQTIELNDDLKVGIYFIVISNDKEMIVRKLVKE